MNIAVIGGFGYKYVNGQTVKTENLCELLSDQELIKIDSSNWKKHPFSLMKGIKKSFKTCDAIIMLPAHRGVKVFSRILKFYNKKYHKKIYYDVIGGWLPEILSKDKKLMKVLLKFDGIWVETDTMKTKLSNLGLNNVRIIPNYKNLKIVNELCKFDGTFRVCTFSRVSYSKGIEDAIAAVTFLNQKRISVKLDIYGPIEEQYKDRFSEVLRQCDSSYISYVGVVDAFNSTQIISNYNALLFPTFYDGEGLAGTLIDAMFSGVPVIASDWKYNSDIIKDGFNGLIYKTRDINDLASKIETLMNVDLRNEIHKNCLEETKKYTKNSILELVKKELQK